MFQELEECRAFELLKVRPPWGLEKTGVQRPCCRSFVCCLPTSPKGASTLLLHHLLIACTATAWPS